MTRRRNLARRAPPLQSARRLRVGRWSLVGGGLASGALVVGCGAAPSRAAPDRVAYRLDAVDANAPALPGACDAPHDGRDDARRHHWIVFVQDDCDACEDWLATLDDAGLADTVRIETAVVGQRCLGAFRVAGAYPFPRRRVGDRDETAWHINSTPITYWLDGDRVRGRLEGRAPLSVLRRAGWLPGPGADAPP
ncbi:MAG: hypothetical protein AAF715_05580 [Myxococcota bacterium]